MQTSQDYVAFYPFQVTMWPGQDDKPQLLYQYDYGLVLWTRVPRFQLGEVRTFSTFM
jgi:hypothetical protein